jgi:serine/threonine protein kinase
VRHPHLTSLVGACPEALCLVYEYLPSVSLHEHLFSNGSRHQLSWKIRARIVAEISTALLFLHSYKPYMIIHGDLRLENILLDSDSHCKITGFGISQIFTDDMKCDPSSCTDPEYKTTKVLTSKSDVYCFGIVILQLLTGKQEPCGLASEISRAMSCGKLSSVLDKTAGDWPVDVAEKLAEFGIRCSEASSRDRPELTPEILRDLKQMHQKREKHIPSFICPISKVCAKQEKKTRFDDPLCPVGS